MTNLTPPQLVKSQNYDTVVKYTTIRGDHGASYHRRLEQEPLYLLEADVIRSVRCAASGAFFVFTGFVVWVIEHQINNNFRGPPSHQLGLDFYFAFWTLVFAHSNASHNLSHT
ncbi:Glutamate receptor 2.7 [Acorus gramineus]|uniref:Glutamate receptor 2.7 n=1 Tax=Acorus gramineus TaxID=55184 RepID=A0AAV9BKQ3_ACOGR|nr:Glutamate receptor 2.7 [Acorus gramineus]